MYKDLNPVEMWPATLKIREIHSFLKWKASHWQSVLSSTKCLQYSVWTSMWTVLLHITELYGKLDKTFFQDTQEYLSKWKMHYMFSLAFLLLCIYDRNILDLGEKISVSDNWKPVSTNMGFVYGTFKWLNKAQILWSQGL